MAVAVAKAAVAVAKAKPAAAILLPILPLGKVAADLATAILLPLGKVAADLTAAILLLLRLPRLPRAERVGTPTPTKPRTAKLRGTAPSWGWLLFRVPCGTL